ncbi:hypothetical protein SAY87_017107 [Trapa incisa]|uniref:Uncharacterized protein n=1 Tax=Trapa incisa TaxID=236973 RepID=A0AAN7L7Y6_9MYRT|nr:hypothetical protein SAY87_017107 [Trapa incisa]
MVTALSQVMGAAHGDKRSVMTYAVDSQPVPSVEEEHASSNFNLPNQGSKAKLNFPERVKGSTYHSSTLPAEDHGPDPDSVPARGAYYPDLAQYAQLLSNSSRREDNLENHYRGNGTMLMTAANSLVADYNYTLTI